MLHKTADKRELANRISEHLEEHPEVRPFPATVTRLLNALQDPNANAPQFEAIIEQDPALAGKLLRLANSPLFSPNGRIESVATAVALLGFRKLKSIAMSVAGDAMFSSGAKAEAARLRLWQHSIGVGVVGRSLAKEVTSLDGDELFLAGVFHDIGKLLFYDVMPELYDDMTKAKHGSDLVDEERYLTGLTHEEVGFKSAKSWELPVPIQAAINWHSDPSKAAMAEEFVHSLALANDLAKHWGIGSEPVDFNDRLASLIDVFGLTEEKLGSIEADSREAFLAANSES